MIQERCTVEHAVDILNQALKLDPKAMTKLVQNRVHCNSDLAKHETIQVGNYHEPGVYTVGLLGILNGLFGIDEDGYGAIYANISDEDGDIIIHEFFIYKDKDKINNE